MRKPTVWVVVLHYTNETLTEACLESLKKLKTGSFNLKILVVYNNPREDPTRLKKKYPAVLFLETGKNLGFAGGNNVGLDYALSQKADWLMTLNNDTEVKPDLIEQLLAVAKTKKDGGAFCPKIYFAKGYEYHKDRYRKSELGKVIWYAGGDVDWANIATPHRGLDEVDRGQFDQVSRVEFANGCAMLVSAKAFGRVGLINESYFLYYEDADFSQRLLRADFKLYYVPKGVVYHKVSASSEIGGNLHDYFMVRNQLLFGWRFAPWRSKLALVKQSGRFLIKGRPWQKQGVKDFYRRKFNQGSWGEKKE